MKTKSILRTCITITALAGSMAVTQAQVIFQDNYEGYVANENKFAWGGTSSLQNYSLSIAPGVGSGGSQGLQWLADFTGSYSGYMAANMGYSGGNPSGNTSTSLSDYTLSFDIAVIGVGLNNVQLNLEGWAGQWFSGAMTSTGSGNIGVGSATPGTGFHNISVNLGAWKPGSSFNPTSQTYQLQWQVNGWELAGGGPSVGQQVVIDNVQITMTAVPEPSSIALVASGLVGLLVLRRRSNG